MPYPSKYPRPNPEGCLNAQEVMTLLGVSRSTVNLYMKQEDFPKPSTERGRLWFVEAEIRTWMEGRTNKQPPA